MTIMLPQASDDSQKGKLILIQTLGYQGNTETIDDYEALYLEKPLELKMFNVDHLRDENDLSKIVESNIQETIRIRIIPYDLDFDINPSDSMQKIEPVALQYINNDFFHPAEMQMHNYFSRVHSMLGIQTAIDDYNGIISSNAKPTLGSIRQNELSQLMGYS